MSSIVKGITDAVKGVVEGVKKAVKKLWKPLLIGTLIFAGGYAAAAMFSSTTAAAAGTAASGVAAGTAIEAGTGAIAGAVEAGTGAVAASGASGAAAAQIGSGELITNFAVEATRATAAAGGASAPVSGQSMFQIANGVADSSYNAALAGTGVSSSADAAAASAFPNVATSAASGGGGSSGGIKGVFDAVTGWIEDNPTTTKLGAGAAKGLFGALGAQRERERAERERKRRIIWGVDGYGNNYASGDLFSGGVTGAPPERMTTGQEQRQAQTSTQMAAQTSTIPQPPRTAATGEPVGQQAYASNTQSAGVLGSLVEGRRQQYYGLNT